MRTSLVIVDDNAPDRDDPLVIRSEEIFDKVEIFEFPNDALRYISDNLNERLVVLLDYKFSDREDTAVQILTKIRRISDLIPVILWTAEIDKIDDYPDLINNKTDAIYSKTDMDGTLKALLGALRHAENSVLEALEEYILNLDDEEKKKIKYSSTSAESFSLDDLFYEISHRTELGLRFEKMLMKLTIKNLMNQ